MRNLKRALSLALASVMVLGMMVVGSSASYKDVSSEYNQEAIEVLQAVGIMTGDENGDFNPDANVTRNEMAVIMCNLLDYTVASYKGTTSFTDVAAWAEPYVAACYTNGIIAGYSDTSFGGDDSVTTSQAALMLMKALGYFQYASDFGDDWQVATVSQGAKIRLFEDVDTAASAALTRNDVAQMVLNALEAEMVDSTGSGGVTVEGEGFTVTTGKAVYEARTSSSSKYGSITNEKAGANGATYYSIQLGEDLYNGKLVKTEGTTDAFQRPGTKWVYNGSEIGTYSDTADLTYTASVKVGTIYSDLGLSKTIKLTDGDDELVTYYVNGTKQENPDDDEEDDVVFPIVKNDTTNSYGGKGSLTEVYYDSDEGTVQIITIETFLLQVDGEYDEDSEELNLTTVSNTTQPDVDMTLSSDDFDNLDTYEDEDYVLVTIADISAEGEDPEYEIQSIQPAEVFTATVTAYTVKSSVTADGTKYGYNTNFTASGKSYTINDDYTFVLDSYGYVIFSDASDTDDQVVYISEFGKSGSVGSSLEADAFFPDGTNDVITVHSSSNDGTDNDDNKLNVNSDAGWYSYTLKSGKYVLTPADGAEIYEDAAVANDGEDDTIATTKVTENGSTKIIVPGVGDDDGDVTYRANAKTVFVVNDDGDVDAYIGIKNVPTITAKEGVKFTIAVIEDGSYVSYVYIDVTDITVKGGSSSSDRVYILETSPDHNYVEDDDGYYTYDAIVNGKKTTIDTVDGDWAIGLYYDVRYDGNNLVEDMTAANGEDDENYQVLVNSATDAVLNYVSKGDVLEVLESTDEDEDADVIAEIILADSYKIYMIDGDKVTYPAISTLVSKYDGSSDTKVFSGTISVTLDDDGYATEIYVQLAAE